MSRAVSSIAHASGTTATRSFSVCDDPVADPLEQAIIHYAGYEAEKWLAHGAEPNDAPSAHDYHDARLRLEQHIPDATARLAALKRVARQARHLVAIQWPLIQTIARHLERHSVLSGATIQRLLSQHLEQGATR